MKHGFTSSLTAPRARHTVAPMARRSTGSGLTWPTGHASSGFTLLELSIVLVIIGLIIGGITVGQDLIRSAELNATISEINKMKTSVNAFRLKYNAVPGDMDNAFDYWGTNCAPTAPQCNGDGNSKVSETAAGTWTNESRGFWLHLELSELFKLPESAHNALRQSKLGGSASYYIAKGGVYLSASPTGKSEKNLITVFDSTGTGSAWQEGGASAIEASQIDTKADDGNPTTGKYTAVNGRDDATATVQVCLNGSAYDLTSSVLGCRLFADLH